MDKELVKQAGAGRWQEIITHFCGPINFTKKHGPCPKCGGSDRFRYFQDDSGGCICSQCFDRKNADGLATVQWLRDDLSFPEVVKQVGEYLGVVQPKKDRKPATLIRTSDTEWLAEYAEMMGFSVEAIQRCNCYPALFAGHVKVVVVPCYGDDGGECGQVMLTVDGSNFRGMDTNKRFYKGGKSGICGMAQEFAGATILLKVEGVTDMLATATRFPGLVIWTTGAGASECPPWMAAKVSSKDLAIIHDADAAGEKGLVLWEKARSTSDKRTHLGRLPYPLTPTKGKDLRDWLTENPESSIEILFEQDDAGESDPVLPAIYDYTDPLELAKSNLRKYKNRHGRILKFWRNEWYRYVGSKYERISESNIEIHVRQSIQEDFAYYFQHAEHDLKAVKQVKTDIVANVMRTMRGLCNISDLKEAPFWLDGDGPEPSSCMSLGNGILNVETLELLPPTPNWFSLHSTDYDWDPESECPFWLEFIEDVFEAPLDRETIQEWAGYCITPDTTLHKAMMLLGEGANGKSSFLAGLKAIIGEGNTASASLQDMTTHRFTMAYVAPKLLNIIPEYVNNAKTTIDEGRLKSIISGDAIQTEEKGKGTVMQRPQCRLLLATNVMPRFYDTSAGNFRRWHVIQMTRQFMPGDGKHVAGLDKSSTWIQRGECSGMLKWALEGRRRLKEQGKLTTSVESETAMLEYRMESSNVLEYLQKHWKQSSDEQHWVSTSDLYGQYRNWCLDSAFVKPCGCRRFGKELKRIFPSVTSGRKRTDKGVIRIYRGLEWSPDSDDSNQHRGFYSG